MTKQWERITEDRYDELLGCLPPALWLAHGFLVGEPWDHDGEGKPRFQVCIQLDGAFYGSLRPMGVPEFRALTRDTIRAQV